MLRGRAAAALLTFHPMSTASGVDTAAAPTTAPSAAVKEKATTAAGSGAPHNQNLYLTNLYHTPNAVAGYTSEAMEGDDLPRLGRRYLLILNDIVDAIVKRCAREAADLVRSQGMTRVLPKYFLAVIQCHFDDKDMAEEIGARCITASAAYSQSILASKQRKMEAAAKPVGKGKKAAAGARDAESVASTADGDGAKRAKRPRLAK